MLAHSSMRHRTWTGSRTAVHIIGFVAEQIEKLGVDHGDQKVKGAVRIAHDKEQRRFPVTQRVQFQLIVAWWHPAAS